MAGVLPESSLAAAARLHLRRALAALLAGFDFIRIFGAPTSSIGTYKATR